MAWNTAVSVPFVVGAASLVLSVAVQKLLDRDLRRDHRQSVTGIGAPFTLPPRLEEEQLARRFSRDSDALGAVTYVASLVGGAVTLLTNHPFMFALAIGIAVLLPVCVLAALLSTEIDTYYKLTIF